MDPIQGIRRGFSGYGRPFSFFILDAGGAQNVAHTALSYIPFCPRGGYSDRRPEPHFRHRASDELVEALIARGLPFALTMGHGQESIDQRYRALLTLRNPFDFATLRRTIDERMAPSSPDTGNARSPRSTLATR